ncbi:hypothetical protein MYXE_33470 [Mycobacterium xenopi]|uniref:PPE domain-containing protein n=1 Tax=Mycobacterium xenopi TaxID=1789 RepID=A0AAD1M256_MYCXE|nr:hypothetical protein MYXE_33470 [Mycobacterium xenopi]
MFFDFAARPPEINSALMYSGAGAGPMVAAAAAFSNLSGELSATAASYQSVISQLTGSAWQGPSAAAMAAAAEPYITWLSTTSGQLQHAASQAIASAAAYETAFAATVPPPVIAANRAQLAMLVSTNFLGQNTPAIAANEAQYAEMWAQDAAAMYGYAASSAAAAQLTPVTPPAETTNPAGLGAQAAAVSNAVSSSATTSGLNGVLSSLTNAQGALANPLGLAANASSGTSIWQGLKDLMNTGIVFNSINSVDVTASWCTMMMISAGATLGHFISNALAGVTVGDVTPWVRAWAVESLRARPHQRPAATARPRSRRVWGRPLWWAACRCRAPGPRPPRQPAPPRNSRARAGRWLRKKKCLWPRCRPGCRRWRRLGAAATVSAHRDTESSPPSCPRPSWCDEARARRLAVKTGVQ